MPDLRLTPTPGARTARHVGDHVSFELTGVPEGWRARLRTNIGRAGRVRDEIIRARLRKLSLAAASWRDVPMEQAGGGVWRLRVPLAEVGYFQAKAYAIDGRGFQHWPFGPNVGVNVHPSWTRTGNTLYCAFPRMFGKFRDRSNTTTVHSGPGVELLDEAGYTVIPPSGKLRDLARALPHIIERLGCRIVHLLPVGPTPTTFARFGRFGSPYAVQDLTMIDQALIDFDKKSTGLEQFGELAQAVHSRGARLMLDVVINHTGWGSRLWEEHPDWFLRGADKVFHSPGAWDVVWEDLVELDQKHPDLWDHLADSFLIWCRRGVDAFRCDAGYKIPVHVWQYIVARVRNEYPDTVFLLEGLGGPWEATESLLCDGGMQWAYSELFQNFGAVSISGYLDHAFRMSETCGPLVHYSETHDNLRLASQPEGRPAGAPPNLAWSKHRNELSALTSVAGGFGFTCGVEWGATERVNVHSSRGMSWDAHPNLVEDLARLNRLITDHPCFFAGATLTRLSPPDAPVYLLRRDSPDAEDSVLVAVNLDTEAARVGRVPVSVWPDVERQKVNLLGPGANAPGWRPSATDPGVREWPLGPGEAVCLASSTEPRGLSGDAYRAARSRADWAIAAWGDAHHGRHEGETTGSIEGPWRMLAEMVDNDPVSYLARAAGAKGAYAPVVPWECTDASKVALVPPGHWLWITDAKAFRARLEFTGESASVNIASTPWKGGHMASVAPRSVPTSVDAVLRIDRMTPVQEEVSGTVRFLGTTPNSTPTLAELRAADSLVLLTNGRGGMARMRVDLGEIRSKYDCLLGANLDPAVPCDRHVFAKRLRAWVDADGFITQLNAANLLDFEPGPPAHWRFVADAGDGRSVEIHLVADMLDGRNTVVLQFHRPHRHAGDARHGRPLPPEARVSLAARVEIEDRSFHSETKRNPGAEHHFTSHTRPSRGTSGGVNGFVFEPAPDRRLRVVADAGNFHAEPEWSMNIPHPIEANRGQEGAGDAYSPGWFELPIAAGQMVTLTASAEETGPDGRDLETFVALRTIETEAALRGAGVKSSDRFGQTLVSAVRAYLARRGALKTLVAGYPWFLDWGRDSLIGARGLVAGGWHEEAAALVTAFAQLEQGGTLPNNLNGGDTSNRETSDAPLWLGVAVEDIEAVRQREGAASFVESKIDSTGRTIADVLRSVACGYLAGAPNGVKVDAASGLVWSPAHYTWMDTNHPPGTPREGYPVEIQALWIRLLKHLARLDAPVWEGRGEGWGDLARRAEASFHTYFWLEECGWYADVLLASPGTPARTAPPSNALRSNCLFVVTLGLDRHPKFAERARRMTAAAARHLVAPGAMRSLAPLPVTPPLPVYGPNGALLNDPDRPYWPHYQGDEDTRRKPAYHNGTAWVWPLATFAEALVLANPHDPSALEAARGYLGGADVLMRTGCLGHLPEIIDGDAPHTPRGCDAQAWSVTEVLRVWLQFAHRGRE
jgi:starch synthase (maltosyl-transferring)